MSKIVTMIRLKPLLNDKDETFKIDIKPNDQLVVNEKKILYDLSSATKQHIFTFDKIYNQNTSTDDIFNNVGIEIVDNFLKKINTTLFVFGQTGSGKTHTIMGNETKSGFISILLNYLFDMKKKIKVNVIEIYNDVCYDIFNFGKVIHQREDHLGNINLVGIMHKSLNSKIDIDDIFNKIKINRKVGISSQNDKSSRSHLQIKIENEKGSFIKILDLAGSERACQSNFINREVFKENAEINKSLLALKECIRSLKLKNSHIPIRSSKLTKLLKDSFTGMCNTYVLGTIAQEQKNIVDSMNTLNYMSDLKYIKKIERTRLPEVKEAKIKADETSEEEINDVNKLPNINYNKISARNYQAISKPKDDKKLPKLYDHNVLSPNYRLVVRNKYMFENNVNSQNSILKKIYKSRSTKKLKSDFLNILDGQELFIKKLKKQLI